MYGVKRVACWWTSSAIIRARTFDRQADEDSKKSVERLNGVLLGGSMNQIRCIMASICFLNHDEPSYCR